MDHVTQCSTDSVHWAGLPKNADKLRTTGLSYSSSTAMRKPRMKSMAFCRSCGVCLPIRLGGGRIRRLAKSVAKNTRTQGPRCKAKKLIKHHKTFSISHHVEQISHTLNNQQWQNNITLYMLAKNPWLPKISGGERITVARSYWWLLYVLIIDQFLYKQFSKSVCCCFHSS